MMKQNQRIQCSCFTALILVALGTLNVQAQAEADKSKLDNIITSIKTNDKSLAVLQQQLAEFLSSRQQFAKELLVVFDDPKSSDLSHYAAACYLGEIRFSDAADALAARIEFSFNSAKYPWYNFPADVSPYPVVGALIKIGNPSIPAVIRNLAESDNAKVRELSLQVLTRIDGDKDIVQLRLQKALKAEKDSQKQARLQAALKSLAEMK
jgi:hypothetical protein